MAGGTTAGLIDARPVEDRMPAVPTGSRLLLAAAIAVLALTLALPPAAAETPAPGYVAMGDSFASGFGLMGATRPCYQAPDAYPPRADSQLDPAYPGLVLTDLACAKASIPAGVLGSQRVGGTTVPPQLPAAEQAAPTFATLTIGANDVSWIQILKDCASPHRTTPCDQLASQPGTYEYAFDASLQTFQGNLTDVLTQIDGWTVRPTLLITLYDWPFPEAFDRYCMGTGMTVSREEFTYLQGLLTRLNDTIAAAAAGAGFATLDLRALFTGHDVCSAEPWSFPFQQPFVRAFHPNDAGHQAIANAVTAALG